MIYLVDTNVLLRLVTRTDPRHTAVRSALRKLRASGHELQTAPQNLAEFWNAATRPISQNGFGLSPQDADRLLRIVERIVALLPDSPATYAQWRRLAVAYNVSGVQVHDARLVALMLVHGITRILTFNTADFRRYAQEGILAFDPAGV